MQPARVGFTENHKFVNGSSILGHQQNGAHSFLRFFCARLKLDNMKLCIVIFQIVRDAKIRDTLADWHLFLWLRHLSPAVL